MPSRLPDKLALVLAGLLAVTPSQLNAQYRGLMGGYRHWSGYGYPVRYGYRAYGAYPYYRGYGGYRGYYGYHRYGNDAWIAVGAGLLGVMIGSAFVPRYPYPYAYPRVVYVPVAYPPPPPPPVQQCPDGSTVPMGSYCAALPQHQAPPLPPAPPAPMPERG